MTKKITIWFICLSILGVQLLNAEEKFLSLKKNKTNVRYGPGLDYQIKYIYRKINLPVKLIDKKENMRRVIFLDNNSGWIHTSQLKPSNSVIILGEKILFKTPSNFSKPIARLEKGRLLVIKKCRVEWCNIKTHNYTGWIKNKNVVLRNPKSTRPWQHVLEAIWGYLLLAANLKKNNKLHGEAFNFGPVNKNNYSVLQVVKIMKKNWKKVSWKIIDQKKNNFYESSLLKLNSNKAEKTIKWKCILTFSETMEMVTNWYKNYDKNPKKIYNITFNQIKMYEKFLSLRSKKNI